MRNPTGAYPHRGAREARSHRLLLLRRGWSKGTFRASVVAAIAAAASCNYDATLNDCRVACTDTSGCPSGFSCRMPEGLCRDPSVTAPCAEIVDGGQPTHSCSSLPATCGPVGTSSCCGSPLVPGGTFYRNDDVGIDGMFSTTAYPATVSDFRLDTYEVTVARFRAFVDAGMGTQASPPASGVGARTLNGMASQGGWDPTWDANLTANTTALEAALNALGTWTNNAGANEALPMNGITWFEAFAFCAWDGGFLPSVTEWNYAAAGGSAQRAYPWSTPASSLVIDCAHANYNNSPNCGGTAKTVGAESPAGDGAFGQADLGGNVWEWVLDYAGTYPVPCTDCAALTPAANRFLRGGSWYDIAVSSRTAFSGNMEPPTFRGYDVGVRCARRAQ